MSKEGIARDPKKVIKSYCVITAPLQELLKKLVHFRWDDEQEDAFVKLKEAFAKLQC